MRVELTRQQREHQAEFRAFVDEEIIPHADRFDRQESIPPDLIAALAQRGYLGVNVPEELGGLNLDMITCGVLSEEIGRGCSSVRSLLTVHGMVAGTIAKWGTKEQKRYWLPRLAEGTTVAGFALTEPNAGSDAKSISTTAIECGDSYVLEGEKKWITFGQRANLFLIFARCEAGPTAFLLEHNTPGLSVEPINDMLGIRASMTAALRLNGCRIPKENLLGKVGVGISYLAAAALDYGRYSVACGCVGIAQACLDASLKYTSERKQFGACLKDHQLIQRMLTDMITNVKAARLLTYHAGYLKDAGDPRSIMETSVAKYFASTTANKAAHDAVQIHGANGCSRDYPVERYMRDAKIMEIIEGSTQLQQIAIASYAYGF